MKDLLKYILLFLVISLVAVGLAITFINSDTSTKHDDYSLKVKQNDKGWFYEIYAGDKILIKQETIPALAGNYHFINKMDAETIGSIALNKVQQGSMPPTISMEDIEDNHIKKSEH